MRVCHAAGELAEHIEEVSMTTPEVAFAMLALLMTPGPTNILLLVAGAETKGGSLFNLVPPAVWGYFLTVIPLSIFGEAMLSAVPWAHGVITAGAAVWVMMLALKMWRSTATFLSGDAAARPGIRGRDVFVTTLLNPKSLILGMVILPGDGLQAHLAVLFVVIVLTGTMWFLLGRTMRQGASTRLPALIRGNPETLIRQCGAVWLGFLSVLLVFGAFQV
jgi:threonine/homoserine/homoserine lactone efflux protein